MTQKIKNGLFKLSILLLAVPVLAPAAAFADNPQIQQAACAGSDIKITSNPSDKACDSVGQGAGTANTLAKTVITVLSAVVGIVAVIMIMFAGFRYVTSGGKEESVKSAKNTILYAIIGLVIVALAQIIVHFVLSKTSQAVSS
jgi:amino acid transporter